MGGIRTETRDGYFILDNPDKRNAVGWDMWLAIPDAVAGLVADDDVRCVVFRGAGDKAFSAGNDISEFKERRSTPQQIADYKVASDAAYAALKTLPKPTVAMVRGFCVGGGVELALLADLRMASDDLRFGVTPARLGLGYNLADTTLLVDAIGPRFAKELLFTGQLFGADDALRMGFVNRLVAAAEIEDQVHDFAQAIAANAPLSVKAAKAIVGEAAKPAAERDEALCQQLVDACHASEDYVEGQRAFAEKRKPQFKGR